MERTSSTDAIARVRRFAGYVQQDPENAALLADAWEAATAAGEHTLAAAFAEAGERCGDGPAALWLQRRAHNLMASNRGGEAAALLQRARHCGLPAFVADHDLACVAFGEGSFEACAALAHPWLGYSQDDAAAVVQAMQVLWLRAMHRLGRLDEAWDWVRAQERAGRGLPPSAAGVAALLAIDIDRFEDARRLADRALAHDDPVVEALTARGCVALAERDVQGAVRWLRSAEATLPGDGRVQSALGLVALSAFDLEQAASRFGSAVLARPAHVGSWHGLGWSRLLQGDLVRAAAAFARAVELDPAFGESHGAVGLVLVLQGDGEAAQPHLRRAHGLDPRNVTASFAQALGSGRLSAAQFAALAKRLLDRPGFFGEKLSARWAEAATGAGDVSG